jgi:CHAT domain-containing protein
VSKSSRTRRRNLLGIVLSCAAALFEAPHTNAREVCDGLLTQQELLLERTFDLPSNGRANITLSLPEKADVLILATERDVDVIVSVLEGSREIGLSASPVLRTGTLRLLIPAGRASPITLQLKATGGAATDGRITLQAIDLTTTPEPCIAIQRELAEGDGAYARGRAISDGVSTDAQADAPKEYRSATTHYLAAIHLQPATPTRLLAHSQLQLATVLYDWVQDWSSARTWASAAADTYRQTNDLYGKARADSVDAAALMEVALSYRSSPDKRPLATRQGLRQARVVLSSLVAFHARNGQPFEQGLAQNNIGLAYYYEGLNDRAIPAYQAALALFQQLRETRWIQIALQNIALTEWELGRITESITQYEQVLAMMDSGTDPIVRSSVLNNAGAAYWVIGRFDWALKQFVEALNLERQSQNSREQARSLHGMGRVYEALGESSLALDFYRQGLALLTPQLDPRGRASALRATANLLRQQDHADEALVLDQEALGLASTAPTHAQIQIQRARDLVALGRPAEALNDLDAVIRTGDSVGLVTLAQARVERARELLNSRNLSAAEADVRAALTELQAGEAPVETFSAWIVLAQVQAARHLIPSALASLDHALQLAEEVRLQSANPEMRAALLQPLRPAFDLKIALLDQLRQKQDHQGDLNSASRYARLALQTSERARARALEDFQRLDTGVPGLTPLLERRRALYKDLASRHFLLEARRASTTDEDIRAQAIRGDIVRLRAQIDSIDTQIASIGGHSELAMPDHELTHVDLQRIPPNAAVIEYWLGDSDAYAWVLTQSNLRMISLGPSAPIAAAALTFHESLASFGAVTPRERHARAERLSALVLQPLQAYFAPHRTLIFSPDQALHYVPFAALYTTEGGPTQFLVADHDVAVAPSVRTLLGSHLRSSAPPEPGKMLLVADPVYTTEDGRFLHPPARPNSQAGIPKGWSLFRGTSTDIDLPRLDGTHREASALASLLPSDRLDRLEGFDATRDRFLHSPLSQYRYIHVASHAVTNADVPGLSALILTLLDRDGRELEGRVLGADLATVRLNAELVVLSGCQTALGRNMTGEGLMGLSYIVRARGARSVVSSLWEVPDAASARLMAGFYDAYLKRETTVGAALSDVMRQMLAGELADPSEWAAFTATISDFRERRRPRS